MVKWLTRRSGWAVRVLGACAWGGNRRARVDVDSDGRSGREKREGLKQQGGGGDEEARGGEHEHLTGTVMVPDSGASHGMV